MATMNVFPSSHPTAGDVDLDHSQSKLLYNHIQDSTAMKESSPAAKDVSSAENPKEKDILPTAPSETAGKPPNTLHQKTRSNSFGKKAPKFDKVKGELFIAKVTAWQEAKRAEINARCKNEESGIQSWEEHQKAKASINLRREEMRLEQRRLKVVADTEKEIALNNRKAQDLKKAVHAKRELELAQLSAEAENLMETGKIAAGCMNN